MNADIHSNNEDKGYKNPHKPKVKGHNPYPKNYHQVEFFNNILQLNTILT